MKIGTKALLFGIHQFFWHPLTVLLAWIDLYGFPKPWELFCIFVHDVGYFGKADLDGEEGVTHPELGGKIAGFFFGEKARLMCLGHSRGYAKMLGIPVSRLCWADKWAPLFDPGHFFWLRGIASGEIHEFIKTFPCDGGQSSLMWVLAFRKHVKSHAVEIWDGSKGVDNPGYNQTCIQVRRQPDYAAPFLTR